MADLTRVTVMTLNAGNGIAPDARLVEALRTTDADVVGLEELNQRQAAVLETTLAGLFPWRAFFGDSNEGRGVLSRYPLHSVAALPLLADRPDVCAEVMIGDRRLTVIVGHPRPQVMTRGRVRFRLASLRQLVGLARVAESKDPAVLMGDFNMGPRHPGAVRFARVGLVDAFTVAGKGTGYTFPLRLAVGRSQRPPEERLYLRTLPVKRFDHIWVTPGLEVEAAWIGPDAGSDHAPVLARIVLPDQV